MVRTRPTSLWGAVTVLCHSFCGHRTAFLLIFVDPYRSYDVVGGASSNCNQFYNIPHDTNLKVPLISDLAFIFVVYILG